MSEAEPPASLWRDGDFLILWLGDAASELGSAMSALVFPLVGYAVTHSTAQAGLATTALFAGSVISGLPAGALVDRWSRRRVLVVTNLVSAAVYGLLAVLLLLGHAGLAVLIVAAFVGGVTEAFFSPAASAALRAVVPREQLHLAYTRMQARHHAASLIGPPLGGALFAVAHGLPFLVDAGSFALFALVLLRLRAALPAPEGERRRVRTDMAEGMRFLWGQPVARAMMLWGGILNFSVTFVLVTVTLRLVRAGTQPAAIGAVEAIAAAAGLLGAFAAPLISRLPTGATTIGTGLVLAAVLLPMGWTTNVVAIGALLAGGTFLLPANNAGIGAYLSSVTPDRLQGRLQSAAGLVSGGPIPLAPAASGVALAALGGVSTTVIGAGLVAASTLPLVFTAQVRRLGPPASWQAAID